MVVVAVGGLVGAGQVRGQQAPSPAPVPAVKQPVPSPEPAPEAKTQLISVETAPEVKQMKGVQTILDGIGDVTQVGAAYSVIYVGKPKSHPGTGTGTGTKTKRSVMDDFERGSGLSVHFRFWSVVLADSLRIGTGPAYALAITDQSDRHMAEWGFSTNVIDTRKAQEKFKQIPILGRLPLDVSDISMYLGVGSRGDRAQVAATIGVGGIRWGK